MTLAGQQPNQPTQVAVTSAAPAEPPAPVKGKTIAQSKSKAKKK